MASINTQPQTVAVAVQEAYDYRSENPVNDILRKKIAVSLGYDVSDFDGIAAEANIGEGCGNPLTIASLKGGEIVVDLGSGAGFDCFLASRKVGPTGKVIGFDMTQKMVDLAQKNAKKTGITNVEFVLTNINKIPLPDNSVDCVISNCVLNLVPKEDKVVVIQEIHRILKPCGRIAVSDFLALKPFTQEIKSDPALLTGCVSGAVEVDQMKKVLYDIGFDDVLLVNTKKDLSLYKDGEISRSVTPCCAGGARSGPGLTASGRKELDLDLNEWISSFQIYGHKWCGKTAQNQPEVCSIDDRSFQLPSACAPWNGCC